MTCVVSLYLSSKMRTFNVSPSSIHNATSRLYDVRSRYHLIKALLQEWACGSRELYGVCQYLTDLGLAPELSDDDIDADTALVVLEGLADIVKLSVALDPHNADVFLAAVADSVVVREL